MITEDYVSFETAKLLKEKGFNEGCPTTYTSNGLFHTHNYKPLFDDIFAPTLQMAMKWLRLRHHFYVHVVIYCDQESGPYWNWFIDNIETGQTVGENTSLMQCDSPEEAYNDGIKYCLENLIK